MLALEANSEANKLAVNCQSWIVWDAEATNSMIFYEFSN